ncbi:response regulator [Brevibacillus fluminis]|uniref:histidine kinase n=2 Tax=Brevibacillus fluminis TaxID=511487 RepID=A0A3M8DK32_9BACL|nr:ATP-binding protein [Brevibacillus fluminis]RNB87477.1 response regulator [Brevibacillus fluminis]
MNRKLFGMSIIFLLSIAIFVGIYNQTIPNDHTPLAKHGVLDLTQWDFKQKGIVPLDGEWEFYPGKLLEPPAFREGSSGTPSYISVPGTWKGEASQGNSYSRKGYGTYRLKVILPDSMTGEIVGLKTRSIRMSHQLYINGRLEGGSGKPAVEKDAHLPGNTPYEAFFYPGGKEVEIVIPVANFMFITGGIVNPIQFGLHQDIAKLNSIQVGTDIAKILFLLLLGSYHLGFYFLRMKERTYLYSGFYMVCLGLYESIYGEKIVLQLLPGIPFEFAYKIQDASMYVSAVLLLMFFQSIDQRLLSRRNLRWINMPVMVFIATILLLPYSVYSEIKVPFLFYITIAHLFMLIRMIFLYIKHRRESSSTQQELLLCIGSSGSLMASLVIGSMYADNLILTDMWGKIAVVSFITFMNILLAVRFNTAYETTEILSRQLAVSNELKDEFLTNTSHEMKTPLHGIQNITSYLLESEEDPLSPKQSQNLRLIKDTSIKLSMLIHDLIDVTRLKQGELRLSLTLVDVRVVTQMVFDILRFELTGKNVWLDNQVGNQVWVLADENRLRQIMYNLVHNAIKHTDQGSITVKAIAANGMVTVSVEDTGTGIAHDKHEAIFGYFEQLDQPLPRDGYTSMGVGLYISRKLVERMGGEIKVAWSQVGEGTRMDFTLPISPVQPAYQEIAAAAVMETNDFPHDAPLDFDGQHGQTILVVDDEVTNIHVLMTILMRHRYNVITAFSAKEALDKMQIHPRIDLIILDVMMPGMSGIELCQQLRQQHSILDLPILFATVKDTPHDIALGYRAGANDYLTKPFDAKTLIARIQTLLAMKTSIRDALQNEQAFHQAQIKPHFLYNALSSVIGFCYMDGQKAAYLLTMLSQYLRFILDMDRNKLFVTLERELDLIEAYVEIEKARFDDRFSFTCSVDEDVLQAEIPSLSIQPFVENAIRHGLFEKEGSGEVTLTILAEERQIRIEVVDDGIGISAEVLALLFKGERKKEGDGGIGIANIRQRLEAIPDASLTISSELGKGTKVTMTLPYGMGMEPSNEGKNGVENTLGQLEKKR